MAPPSRADNVINHIYRIFKRVRIFHLPHEFPRITLAASPFLLILVLHDTPYAPPPQTEHFPTTAQLYHTACRFVKREV